MEFIEQHIPGVWEIRLRPIGDERGFFMRAYDRTSFEQRGLHRDWLQENHALSTRRGTLRGLHFQFPPHAETKLVRVVRGEILDVFVDLRQNSPTFGRWGAIHLSDERKNLAYVPRGFAHGYQTLSEVAEVIYKVDSVYAPDYEGGLSWDDPDLGIEWPVLPPILSEKDTRQPSLQEFIHNQQAIKLIT
mgnify:FL=1